ncbi:MAG TPA: hypothetical protein VMU33_10625 [Burkholderiaceae bacterium]|nr:hypothetical protein [Burkholderiaceae bacterium]
MTDGYNARVMMTSTPPVPASSTGIDQDSAEGDVPVTCPFCGLLCDDVAVSARESSIDVRARGCATSRDGFARAGSQALAERASPRIKGRSASLDDAIAASASILRDAALPLISGLATDVAGARAALALADRCGAVVDHMNSPAKFRNLLAFQDRGWVSTTLAEARNRADVVVVIGARAEARFPRLFERILGPADSLVGLAAAERRIVVVGRGPNPSTGPAATLRIEVDATQLHDVVAGLAAIAAKRPIHAAQVAGIPLERLRAVVELLRGARYGVVTWAAPDLEVAHAELAVQAIARLVAELNATTRCAALPLGGTDGDFTADAVSLWQTGLPFRTSFASGKPRFEPWLHDGRRMLQGGEVDALLWIATLGVQAPPKTALPTIMIGSHDQVAAADCDVAIPVGTPGIDHAGHLVRVDKVVTLRLAACRPSSLPRAAEVLDGIRQRI